MIQNAVYVYLCMRVSMYVHDSIAYIFEYGIRIPYASWRKYKHLSTHIQQMHARTHRRITKDQNSLHVQDHEHEIRELIKVWNKDKPLQGRMRDAGVQCEAGDGQELTSVQQLANFYNR